MNKICLVGRITKDLELKSTPSGKSVCEFTIAVSRDKDNSDFINCRVWNAPAENLVKYQGKGSLISAVGELRTDSYDRQDGTKGYKTYVLANNIEYLGTKGKEEQQEEQSDPFADFGDTVSTDDFLD